MKTYFDCVACIIRQGLDAVKQVSSDENVIERVLRLSLKTASEIDYNRTPAEISRIIHRIIREETGNPDPYLKIKNKANETAMSFLDQAREKVKKAENPFDIAVRYAIAGNILDFALYTQWDDNRFLSSLQIAEKKELLVDDIAILQTKIEDAQTILYLGDNAGEVVFDRLLLELLPDKEIFYAVKGEPVINDVLKADALYAGIDKFARIISNGTDSAGTVLSLCSEDFLQLFESADVVISKGQGNYETLNDCSRDVFFLTQIKCKTVARDLQGSIGDWIVKYKKR